MDGKGCSSCPYKEACKQCDSCLILMAIEEFGVDGIWDWRIKEGVEYYNKRFREILGYTQEEFPNTPDSWRKCIYPEDIDKALSEYVLHVESKGKHPYRLTVRYNHKQGHTVHVICRGAIVEWDDDGEPLRMIGTHVDITELVIANDQLNKIHGELQETRKRIEALHNGAK